MPLGGYLSGTRMARDTAKISRHNQCGGPKKQGLAPQGAWMRQGMGNLKIVKSCKDIHVDVCIKILEFVNEIHGKS